MENPQSLSSKHNFMFWFHVFITSLAWVGPFLFSWQIMLTAYTIILLQFFVFGKCLLNDKHDLTVSEDATFYSYLFEACGMTVNRPLIKLIVRRYLYFVLGALTVVWQVYLGHKALLF
jgi:hypothetical protein